MKRLTKFAMQAIIESNVETNAKQKGISLFVVISALLILSVLTLSITAQLMAPVYIATSATQQINRSNDLRSALQVIKPLVRLAANNGSDANTALPKLDSTPI